MIDTSRQNHFLKLSRRAASAFVRHDPIRTAQSDSSATTSEARRGAEA